MSGRIEGIVARLHGLHPRLIDLSLDRLLDLLAKLDHPEQRLPPVIHVAGTNGKGSTCAFLRAMAEAAGLRVHVYTSPHLVRFNERIRIAGELVSDDALAQCAGGCGAGQRRRADHRVRGDHRRRVPSVRATPADLCVLEVGLGGRGDATNVIAHPAACAITSISLDHRELLGETLELDRRGEGRHHEARRAGRDRCAAGIGVAGPAGMRPRARRPGANARSRLAHRTCAPRLALCRCERRARPAAAVAARCVPDRQCRHRDRRAACVGPGCAE